LLASDLSKQKQCIVSYNALLSIEKNVLLGGLYHNYTFTTLNSVSLAQLAN